MTPGRGQRRVESRRVAGQIGARWRRGRLATWAVLPGCLLGLLAFSLPGRSGEQGQSEPGPIGGTAVTPASPNGATADNRRCFVCHANYDFFDEPLAFSHAKANIGCVRCHGESTRHSADEDGLTPPDRMFARSRIRFNCLGCHDYAKLVATDAAKRDRADLKEKPDHQAVLDGRSEKRFCTDCHGEHRLAHRTRVWDKRTGQLTYKDSTPRMLGGAGAQH